MYAMCKCPVKELLKAHTQKGYEFVAKGIRSSGEKTEVKVNAQKFPDNFDNYHFKIVQLAQRFLDGEKHLMY